MPECSHKLNGITCAGNWIVDHVKMVDHLPGLGMLGNIKSETLGTGGAPFNVLVGLARMNASFPLIGIGVLGSDSGKDFVMQVCRSHNIDVSAIATIEGAVTSYTDVMTEIGSGVRVFYHCRGANAGFGIEHVPVSTLSCRIFHLGYLLLLDRLDQPDDTYGTVAARLLKHVQDAGIKTSVDVVSEESDRFQRIVPAALRYTNYLILNEIEAGKTTGKSVRSADGRLDGSAVIDAVEALYEFGDMDMVVVHMPEGVYLRSRDGCRISRGSLALPTNYINGSVGAGDAFCAGMLYGIHEGWDYEKAIKIGNCAAAACLANVSATDGLMPLSRIMEIGKRFPEQEPPVKV
ncbi:MAG: carbohydrate kinase family protein [Planctomycetes bacterium]|nr:carbohydrate kinase family protein [Planctomycetota bacterium]